MPSSSKIKYFKIILTPKSHTHKSMKIFKKLFYKAYFDIKSMFLCLQYSQEQSGPTADFRSRPSTSGFGCHPWRYQGSRVYQYGPFLGRTKVCIRNIALQMMNYYVLSGKLIIHLILDQVSPIPENTFSHW